MQDFCKKDTAEAHIVNIGQKAKIWHEGGIYSSLASNKHIKWPSEEIKRKSNQFAWKKTPKAGDIGTIVHVFPQKDNNPSYIYLLKFDNYYVPVHCGYLVHANQPDVNEQSQLRWIRDSLENVKYAAGCQFKLWGVNGNWSRTGMTDLDKMGESFACKMASLGIDTVMLCKYMGGNGPTIFEKAFVLWIDNGQGFVKAFFNNSKHQPTENKIVPFDANTLVNHFFVNRIDTVTSEPKTELYESHSMVHSIQLYIPGHFYRKGSEEYLIRRDTKHPKVIWYTMILEKLSVIKPD